MPFSLQFHFADKHILNLTQNLIVCFFIKVLPKQGNSEENILVLYFFSKRAFGVSSKGIVVFGE